MTLEQEQTLTNEFKKLRRPEEKVCFPLMHQGLVASGYVLIEKDTQTPDISFVETAQRNRKVAEHIAAFHDVAHKEPWVISYTNALNRAGLKLATSAELAYQNDNVTADKEEDFDIRL